MLSKLFHKEYPEFWKLYLAKFESKTNRYVILSTQTTGLNPKKTSGLPSHTSIFFT